MAPQGRTHPRDHRGFLAQRAPQAGLRYVYVGNVPGEANTVCHECGKTLIRRSGYRILENHIQPDGRCPNCGTPVAGVGMG